MRYPSKVDWWIAASVAIGVVGLATAVLATQSPVALIAAVASLAILAVLCWPCDYTLGDTELVVRSGCIRWNIPYSQVTKIEPTTNPLSSPAWSLDRVLVAYGGKSMMISPVRKDEFMIELAVRCRLKKVGVGEGYLQEPTRQSGTQLPDAYRGEVLGTDSVGSAKDLSAL